MVLGVCFALSAPLRPALAQESPDGLPADEPPPQDSVAESPPVTEAQASTTEQTLPKIEAREFEAKVVRRSNSNRVYLLEDASGATPRVGRIVLLKREAQPMMAFRVLRTYGELKQFAGKRVRKYGKTELLANAESFRGLEKLRDLVPPPLTPQDNQDLKELEDGRLPAADGLSETLPPTEAPKILAYDPELDAGSSPPPVGGIDTADARRNPAEALEQEDETDYDDLGLAIEEVNSLDMHHHWLTGQGGYVRNIASDGGLYYATAGGVRYGLTIAKMLFLRGSRVQDSLVVEGGGLLYKILNYEEQDDAYTVVAGVGTVRYNILFGESFGLFVYGGLLKNYVVNQVNGSDFNLALLSSTLPAGGAGLIFHIGPSWDARIDVGMDMFAMGLMLRF